MFILLYYVDLPNVPEGSADSIDWAAAGLIAVGSVIGGQLGATVGRRLSPNVLRGVIVVVGVVAVATFVFPL